MRPSRLSPRLRRPTLNSLLSRYDVRHAASCSYGEAGAPSDVVSLPSTSSLPFFLPNWPNLPSPKVAREEADKHRQLLSVISALHNSPTFSPYMHDAHILRVDSAAFPEATSSSSGAPSPSSSTVKTQPPPRQQESHEQDPESQISDQEWEIRTGRGIYILQETLPTFFSTGLISSLDLPEPATRHAHTPSLTESLLSTFTEKGKQKMQEETSHGDSIYSPRVRLEYKPPVALPPPLPRTLKVEGLHLYIASSVFVRHTLNALYTDLRVEIRRARVHGPPKSESSRTGISTVGPSNKYRKIREKSFFMELGVTGASRVSGAPAEWTINCTYTFSPTTGLIHIHTVDSIEPAPHATLFEAMSRFGLVGGGTERSGSGGMSPTGCDGRGGS